VTTKANTSIYKTSVLLLSGVYEDLVYFKDKYNFNNVQASFYMVSNCFHAPQVIIIVFPNERSQYWNSEMIVVTAIITCIRGCGKYLYIGYFNIHWIFQNGKRECKSMQQSGMGLNCSVTVSTQRMGETCAEQREGKSILTGYRLVCENTFEIHFFTKKAAGLNF
jgi:hypothetical protein